MLSSASLRLRLILAAAAFGLIAAACGGGTETAAVDDATAPAAETSESDAAEAEESTEAAETPAVDPGLFGGEFIDLNGESIDLASFEGQDVVLWFWAPW